MNLLAGISRFYGRSGIRRAIFVSFTLSAVVAAVASGVLFYWRFSSQLSTALQDENRVLVDRLKLSLDTYMGNMMRLMDAVDFRVVKNADVTDGTLSEQLQLLYNSNSAYVKTIALFSSEGRMIASAPPAVLKEGSKPESTSWFSAALGRLENLHFSTPEVHDLFAESDGARSWVVHLSCSTELTEEKIAKKGVLLLDLKYSGISELFRSTRLAGGGYVFLADRDGTIVYHPHHQLLITGLADEPGLVAAGYPDGEYVVKEGGKSYSLITRTVGYTGWVAIGVIPHTGLAFSGSFELLFALLVFTLYFALTVVVNAALSNKLTEPIELLEQSVKEVERGAEGARIFTGGPQEIDSLGRSIRRMVEITRRLADDVVAEHTQKQKSEQDALQAQINPHFLYNTLDILVWVIEKGKPDEALEIVSALGRFFRLGLSRGKNVISLRDELEHVRSYLMIQDKRFKNRFTYKITAEGDSASLRTVKLVLQPIVENAIYHGMEFMSDGDGAIDINARVEGGDLLLTVTDNGPGMTDDMVAAILDGTHQSKRGSGIGVRNVHERIALYFGEGYGVSIKSEPDVGTAVTLRLPALPYEEEAVKS